MRKPEIIAAVGKEVTRVWGYNQNHHEPVTILGYGYDYDRRYGRDRKIVQYPKSNQTLVRDAKGKEFLVSSRDLINRPYAEYKAERDAEAEAERQARIARHEDRQRRTALGERLVELLGFGSVSNWDGYGSRAGQVSISVDDVPKLIDKLEQELIVP